MIQNEEHNEQEDMPVSGGRLGSEAADRVMDRAERYCESECERIALTNEPQINVLQAEGHDLEKRTVRLEEQLRAMPRPGGDEEARKRRVRYYAAVAAVLTLAACAFTVVGFGPFRLGAVGIMYCVGIGVVTPFAVDELLRAWKAEMVVKTLAIVIFLAAIVGGGLLAAVRGDLLSRKVAQETPTVVIDDGTPPAAPSPQKSFYEETAVPLRILMLLFAFAIDLGAGIALYRARSDRPANQAEYEALTLELAEARSRLLEIVHEITALTNAPRAFAAQFWRDFYRGTLTQTVRNSITKGVTLIIVACAVWSHGASAGERLNLVAAIDLSTSQSVKGADHKTPFDRNVEGVARLLASLPAASHVTIIAITKDSVADPAPLFSARISDDEGYFGERLKEARTALVRAWRARAARLAPTARGTDILGALQLASEIFKREPKGSGNVLVVFSDMRNETSVLSLKRPHVGLLEPMLKTLQRQHQIADLAGVTVYVVGANGGGKSIKDWNAVKEFWTAYFMKAGARCGGYSILATAPLFGQWRRLGIGDEFPLDTYCHQTKRTSPWSRSPPARW